MGIYYMLQIITQHYYYFFLLNYSSFGHWELFQVGSYVLST